MGRGENIEKPVVFGMPEKLSMMMDYPRRQQQAVCLVTGQGLLTCKAQRISLQAQRHQRTMPESLVKL